MHFINIAQYKTISAGHTRQLPEKLLNYEYSYNNKEKGFNLKAIQMHGRPFTADKEPVHSFGLQNVALPFSKKF